VLTTSFSLAPRAVKLIGFLLLGLLLPLTSPAASADEATFQLSYDANVNQHQPGVVSGSVPPLENKAAGSIVTVATNSGNLARQGFTFAGWNTAPDGTRAVYAAGSGTFVINANTTLYAKWEIPSSARLLANINEVSTVVNITDPNNVFNGSVCTSGGLRGITSDGSYIYIRPSAGPGYICKLTMDGIVVSVLDVGASLTALSLDSVAIAHSRGCIFIQPSPSEGVPPDNIGNTTLYCIQLSDSTMHTILLPTEKPLFPGKSWLSGNLVNFPDGRIGVLSQPYTPEQFLASGADTSIITNCPPTNFCKVLRLYTLSGTGRDVIATWSEDMVIAEGDFWPDDDHGIASDGAYLYQTNFASGYRVYALRSGALSYTVFNGMATTFDDSGSNCGASIGISGRLCLINYPVTGNDDAGKVLFNNTYVGRNHTTNQYVTGDYEVARFWVSNSVVPPVGPGSAPSAGITTQPRFVSCPVTSISSLSPLGGTSSGGTRLTINGEGLTSSVYINSRIADVSLESSTSVTVLTPPGTKGAATLRIDGCNASATFTYLYDPDPVISSLSTSSISTTGANISITGKFLSGAVITIGTARATISSNTDELITAALPALSAGEKTMTITTTFGSTVSKLTYLEPPSLRATLSTSYIAQGDTVSFAFTTTETASYSSSGILPSGLSLDAKTGLLSGVATKEGIYNFTITATNTVGSDSKTYALDIDRPTPKVLGVTIYYSHKNTSLSPSNKASLDRLIARIKLVAPRNIDASITMSGGAGNTETSLTSIRHDQIKAYLQSQGVRIKSSISTTGSANKVEITAGWIR
jgi:hypothetical protein